MPRLNRCYGHGFLHFITFSCYRRLPLLQRPLRRHLFLRILEQVRRRYRCLVLEPEQWGWSSFRHYSCHERGPVLVNEPLCAEMKIRATPQNDSSAA